MQTKFLVLKAGFASLVMQAAVVQASGPVVLNIQGVLDGVFVVDNPPVQPQFVRAWANQPFSLNLNPAINPVPPFQEAVDDIPGAYATFWPATVQWTMGVPGAGFHRSGIDNRFSEVETIDNLTIPAGLTDLPSGITAGSTYDVFGITYSNFFLGCVSGGLNGLCDGEAQDISEGLSVSFLYAWDTATRNPLIAGVLPDVTQANFFTGGTGWLETNVWRYSVAAGGEDIAWASHTVNSVAVVPEAETWAMMLAGLGLVGFSVARRRKSH